MEVHPFIGGVGCTWVKPGRFGSFFSALFPSTWRTLSPDALLTRIWDTPKHPESATFRAFPASIWEHSPRNAYFFMGKRQNCQIVPALPSYRGGVSKTTCFTVFWGPHHVFVGHFLRGKSLKGRCNIRVYVPVCVPVCVCVCVCVPPLPPLTPAILWGRTAESPPTPPHDPSPPFPHPYPQAIAGPTPGKNYPLKSARIWGGGGEGAPP